ncbi:hypothetical protein [Estrella lausannensis]|nr:hypothetical protein [Estrella lausannensis]
MKPSPCFLVMLVDAPHFDYSDGDLFLRSWRKHPQGGRKDGTVGHAWIYLRGVKDGKVVEIEGGHSGERGVRSLTYMEGVDLLIQRGEKNPVRYLFESLEDGYFESGSGTHRPTFAAKIDLTREQFEAILAYIHPSCYPYKSYSLTGRQCASFVVQVAALADLSITAEVTLPLPKCVRVGRQYFSLYEDEKYSTITFCSPDMVEQELIRRVFEGRAEYALDWYFAEMKCCLDRK